MKFQLDGTIVHDDPAVIQVPEKVDVAVNGIVVLTYKVVEVYTEQSGVVVAIIEPDEVGAKLS